MTFFQFASNNVRRNTRAYAAYFMSSAFAILVFFLYAVLAGHPSLAKGYVDTGVISGMKVAEGIIFVFSFFSILYSMGSFLKGRSKEFGILTMLGITNRQLIGMIFLENMLLGIAAIVVGLAIGLLGSKLFLLLGASILDTPDLPFYFPTQALLTTGIAFIVLFFIVSIATTIFTRNTTVLTLLKGNQRPKQEPRASLLLALLSAVLLITGYVLALTYQVPVGSSLTLQPLLIIVIIAIGTYLLYSQLSVLLIRVIRKRRSYYWRGTHMLWLSELAYSMKDNARLFFAIAMVLSVSFTATGAVAVVKAGMPSLGSYPFAFSLNFTQSNSKLVQPTTMLMTQTLNTNHIAFTTVQAPFITHVNSKYPFMSLMSVTDYNRLAASARIQQLTVQPGGAVDTDPNDKFAPDDTISAGQGSTQLQIIRSTVPLAINQASFEGTNPFVVTDQEYQSLSTHAQHGLYIGYNVAQWRTTTSLSSALNQQIYSIARSDPQEDSFNFTSHAFVYLFAYQLPNITLFIGLFTAIIFLIASGSFLYFRLYTILNANKEQYRAISKIGFTEAEMRTSVTIQVVILFFAPFLIAVINAVLAMVTLKNNLHTGLEILLPTVETIGIFLAIQIVYFLIIRAQYLNQLKQALV